MSSNSFLDKNGFEHFWSLLDVKITAMQHSITNSIRRSSNQTLWSVGRYLISDGDGTVKLTSLPNASTGARGITYLVDSYTRTDTDKAVTPRALNAVYGMLPTTIDDATIESIISGTYSEE